MSLLSYFRKATPGAGVTHSPSFTGGPNPYSTTLGPSNSIGPKGAVVGNYQLPNTTYQQPHTAPPTPQAGPKGIQPDTAVVPLPARVVPLFAPAPAWNPNPSAAEVV